MLMPLLLMLVAVQSGSAATGPVSVAHVAFEPADLSVSYVMDMEPGVTYYKTQIVWRFSDGTSIEQSEEVDWFFSGGFASIGAVVPVNPFSALTLPPSSSKYVPHYVRKPKTQPPAGSVLVDADVSVVAAILSSGSAFGVLHVSERELSEAPRYLNDLVGVIEQQADFLRKQSGQ